jgi:hypothetical protein
VLYAITNGGLKWAFQTGGDIVSSPLLLSNGEVIVTCEDGNVYAVAGCGPLASSPWPMFAHDPQHTGSVAGTNVPSETCEAPFPNNGNFPDYISGPFSFDVVGPPSSTWSVRASTNLVRWFDTGQTVTLDANGNGSFTDATSTNAQSMTNEFYYLTSNGCCSRALGYVIFNRVQYTNFLADPFYQIDDVALDNTVENYEIRYYPISYGMPMNSVASLFSGSLLPGTFLTYFNTPWDENNHSPCLDAGATLSTWTGSQLVTQTNQGSLSWDPAGDIEMLPGVGVILNDPNPSSDDIDGVLWFMGLVPTAVTNQIQPGINYLGSALPIAGGISTDLGYTNAAAGDTLEKWDPINQRFITYTNNGGASWSPNEPYIGLCEGFILNSATNQVWIQKCSPCTGD